MGNKLTKDQMQAPIGHFLVQSAVLSPPLDMPIQHYQLVPLTIQHIMSRHNHRHHSITLCSQSLVQLNPTIIQLPLVQCLQLCCNLLTRLPMEIGQLTQLTILDISKNQLTKIPESIGQLVKLIELKLNNNKLKSLPNSITNLTKLNLLSVHHNQIRELPTDIGLLSNLSTLDVSHNRISSFPAQLGRLPGLRILRTEGCPLIDNDKIESIKKRESTGVLSLMELAARCLANYNRHYFHFKNLEQATKRPNTPKKSNRHSLKLTSSSSAIIQPQQVQIPKLMEVYKDVNLPLPVANLLHRQHECTYCKGSYFETEFLRFRFIEKNEVNIPLIYKLCSPHWDSDQERIGLMFCAPPQLPIPPAMPSPTSPTLTNSPTNNPNHYLMNRRRRGSVQRYPSSPKSRPSDTFSAASTSTANSFTSPRVTSTSGGGRSSFWTMRSLSIYQNN